VPFGVATEIGPELVCPGTVVLMLVAVAAATGDTVLLNLRLFLEGIVSKFVPVTVTAVDGVPILGLKPVIEGAPVDEVTVKTELLEAEPLDVVTPIDPVVAPDGTVVTIRVAVDELTVALTPLNVTVFWLGVVLKPVP
jgi:hypothetical protein